MTPTNDETYSLRKLSELTGVEVRTIRYYISIDLLPPPLTRGRSAGYTPVHRQRLDWIRQLSKTYKLEEIRQFFQVHSEEEIQELLNKNIESASEAMAYLNSVAAAFQPTSPKRDKVASKAKTGRGQLFLQEVEEPDPLGEVAPLEQLLHKLAPEKGARHVPARTAQRWEVIEIVPGIELHVRDPSRSLLSRLERVGDYIRHLLKGGYHD